MGKYNMGIMGTVSGKVGIVVGATWRNIHYLRMYQPKVGNPRSVKQLVQRARFSVAGQFAKALRPVINTGWRHFATGKTPANAFVSYMLNNSALTGDYPDYEINYANVLVSAGNLTGAKNAAATLAGTVVDITWDDNSYVYTALPDDKTIVAVVNADKGELAYELEQVERLT